jgi:hypothetical protein
MLSSDEHDGKNIGMIAASRCPCIFHINQLSPGGVEDGCVIGGRRDDGTFIRIDSEMIRIDSRSFFAYQRRFGSIMIWGTTQKSDSGPKFLNFIHILFGSHSRGWPDRHASPSLEIDGPQAQERSRSSLDTHSLSFLRHELLYK